MTKSIAFRFQPINSINIGQLSIFLAELGESAKSFRYFTKRPINIVLSHLISVLIINELEQPVAYGHLEYEDDTVWLGIAVAEAEQGNGLGKQMMEYLIDQARTKSIKTICLTVDKENKAAIYLYEKFRFIMEEETDYFYKYALRNL